MITSSYPSQSLKVSLFVHEYCRNLTEAGHSVVVVAPHVPTLPLREVFEGVEVVRFRYAWPEALEIVGGWRGGIMAQLRRTPLAWLGLPLFVWAMLSSSLATARRAAPEHILSFWLIPGGTVASLVARLARVPYSIITPSSEIAAARGRLVPLFRSAAHHAQVVFANSQYALDQVQKALAPVNAILLPVGVPLSRFPFKVERHIQSDSLSLLVVGRLVPWKGTVFAVRALGKLVASGINARLTIVGEGPMHDAVLDEAARQCLTERVSIRANLSHSELLGLYHESHVMLQPSIPVAGQETEGLGVTLLEAQACGLNVVASNVGGIPTAVIDEATGLLVQAGDAEALAAAVHRLISNPALAESLRVSARERIEREFDWQVLIPRMLEAIEFSPVSA